jgi:transcriptional regulator with XRE-family HTH domain
MVDNKHRKLQEHPIFIYRRFRASLDLRGASVESVARQAQVTSRHVWHVLTGRRRGSAALLDTIRQALGDPGWAFATGQTDTLRDEGADHAAG